MSQEASAPPMIDGTTEGAIPPGEMLRVARESAGLSQEDIAGKLKLAARQISAIETGDWNSLPERTFTRGFMRSYARLVGMDPASLGLEQALTPAVAASDFKPSADPMGEVPFDPSGKSRGPARWAVPALLITALVVGALYYQGDHLATMFPAQLGANTSPPSLKTALATQAELDTTVKQAAISAPLVATAGHATAATPEAAKSDLLGTAPTSGGVISPPLPNVDVAAGPAALLAAAESVSPPVQLRPGEKRIAFTFKGKSWTEVRSKGNVIFSENAQPGTREIAGTPPLSFAVGNASNVTLSVDGKPFDMVNVTRNDVARFRIE